MLYALWRWIQLFLPYGFILWIYRHNKAIKPNIKTAQGNKYKAVLITNDYGILFSAEKYIENRGKYLMEQKKLAEQYNNHIISELNELDVIKREDIYREYKD